MVSIPTPIPQSVVSMGSWLRNGPWLLRLYRVAITIVGLLVLYVALQSSVAFIATLAGIAAGFIFADDVIGAVRDIWNLNFWVFKV